MTRIARPSAQIDRLQLGVEIVEIGAGAEIHVPAGHRDGVADLADRLFLAGLDIFIRQQDFALGLDAVEQFAGELPAIDHHIHAIGPDLLGIGRQHRDAVIGRAEQIAGAVVIGHRIGAAAEFGERGFLGELPGVDLLLQPDRHVAGQIDDGTDLVDPGVQHLPLHQIARENARDAEAEQSDAHQNAEFGGDRQIVQLQGTSPGCVREARDGRKISPSRYGENPLATWLRKRLMPREATAFAMEAASPYWKAPSGCKREPKSEHRSAQDQRRTPKP